jgi:YHS domain-containing protein
MRKLIIAGSLLALVLAIGCGGSDTGEQQPPQEQESSAAVLVTEHMITPEEIGMEVTCPVSGDTITVSETTPAVEYDGEVYYFCSEDEKVRFEEDPDRFLIITEEIDPAEQIIDEPGVQ